MDHSWRIAGIGETLIDGVARELHEETGVTVRVIELIEALERIFFDSPETPAQAPFLGPGKATLVETADTLRRPGARPRYHYVILDYLCELVAGEPIVGDEITDVAFVSEGEMAKYRLTPAATRVIRKAFAMARAQS